MSSSGDKAPVRKPGACFSKTRENLLTQLLRRTRCPRLSIRRLLNCSMQKNKGRLPLELYCVHTKPKQQTFYSFFLLPISLCLNFRTPLVPSQGEGRGSIATCSGASHSLFIYTGYPLPSHSPARTCRSHRAERIRGGFMLGRPVFGAGASGFGWLSGRVHRGVNE